VVELCLFIFDFVFLFFGRRGRVLICAALIWITSQFFMQLIPFFVLLVVVVVVVHFSSAAKKYTSQSWHP
jgi:hypothetical protein